MSRGSLFRIAGPVSRLRAAGVRDLRVRYILGVEQLPSDSAGDRHRIDVEVRRRDVTIRSRQAFVLSPARLAGRAREKPEAALRETLSSPFAVSGLPLAARSPSRIPKAAKCDSSWRRRLVKSVQSQAGPPLATS